MNQKEKDELKDLILTFNRSVDAICLFFINRPGPLNRACYWAASSARQAVSWIAKVQLYMSIDADRALQSAKSDLEAVEMEIKQDAD